MKLLTFALLFLPIACRSVAEEGPEPFLGNPACPMSGEPVDPESYFEHEGERVYFCNPHCARDGSREPDRFIAAAYPASHPVENEHCPVCGERSGDTAVTWQGHQVSLCSPRCTSEFQERPRALAHRALARR